MSDEMDWLSRLLEMVPVAGRVEYRCFLGAPWRLDNAARPLGEIPYHIILAGSALLEDPSGGPARRLVAGDILLVPDGGRHVLHDGGDTSPATMRQSVGPAFTRLENDGAGEQLDMLCGRFVLSAVNEKLVREHLPARLVVSAAEHNAGITEGNTQQRLASLVELLRMESGNEHLGVLAMLNALSTAMFAFILRLASEVATPPDGLLALAANPRLAPALSALFNQPERPWTLPELAGRCNMSRATFVRQFQQRLGRSAADLLTDIRMTLAADQLRTTTVSTGALAERVGYQSEAAFQRAFKQHVGVTPAQYRNGSGIES